VGGTCSQSLRSHATPFSFNALFYGAWAALLRLLRWEGDAVLESRVNGCATLVDRKEPCTDDLLLRCCHKVWLTDDAGDVYLSLTTTPAAARQHLVVLRHLRERHILGFRLA